MFKNFYVVVLISLLLVGCQAQKVTESNEIPLKTVDDTPPKLVVGIIVDQMRYDYLTRFYNRYGEGGFKRMVNEGFTMRNNHFNYIPTFTGPGHSSVFTGTTPKYHGIIGNNWYDKESKKMVYCAGDDTVNPVGTEHSAGKMSPHRMKTTTFTDQNRLFTQMRGKTIGVSLKDRGSILPAGHTANAAYWFHGADEGRWISSSFYMEQLPVWVSDFNASKKADSYLKSWNTLYPVGTYRESGLDENDFEGGFSGKETATFPYELNTLKDSNGGYDILKATPYGNSLTADFAMAAIKGEDLGKDEVTDVLTLSFSSTDYVGHNFGVNSKEIEDTYLRLDQDLERFFNFLDQEVGQGDYTVFLTADHGAIDVPSYLGSLGIPSGYLDNRATKSRFEEFVKSRIDSTGLIENISNDQIFLNRMKIDSLGLNLITVQEQMVNELIGYDHIDKVYSAHTMSTNDFNSGIEELLQNGYNQKRSGDLLMVPDASFISYHKTGSTHGSGFNYDTHVPLLFFGKGVRHGSTFQKTKIVDVAPTISAIMGISLPNASNGTILEFIMN